MRQITSVDIDVHRWYLVVTVSYSEGQPDEFVFAADEGDGIRRFGSLADYQALHS
jgi:hypothetical protein